MNEEKKIVKYSNYYQPFHSDCNEFLCGECERNEDVLKKFDILDLDEEDE